MKRRRKASKDFNPEKFLADELNRSTKADSKSLQLAVKTLAACNKMDRIGDLFCLQHPDDPNSIDAESRLVMVALLAYSWTEHFPDDTFHPAFLRGRLCDALQFAFPADELEAFVDKAIGLAARFQALPDRPGEPA